VTDQAVGPEVTVPDYVEAITGYRAWRPFPGPPFLGSPSRSESLRLVSTGHDTVWPPGGTLEAEHDGLGSPLFAATLVPAAHRVLRLTRLYRGGGVSGLGEPDVAPVEGCSCGIYAFARPEEHGGRGRCWLWHGLVYGEVLLWGKVVRHTYGYRAQYARIGALYTLEHSHRPVDSSGLMYDSYAVEDRVIHMLGDIYNVPVVGMP